MFCNFLINNVNIFFRVRESHGLNESQQESSSKMKEAFGVSKYIIENPCLDPTRVHKEQEPRASDHHQHQQQQHQGGAAKGDKPQNWTQSSSPSPERGSSSRKDKKDKKKKKKRSRDR